MRLLLIAACCTVLSGCFVREVYVYPARAPLPVLQRTAITPNAQTIEELRENQRKLIADFMVWEGVVLRRNKAILEYLEEHGYPTDPDSVFPRDSEGNVIRD